MMKLSNNLLKILATNETRIQHSSQILIKTKETTEDFSVNVGSDSIKNVRIEYQLSQTDNLAVEGALKTEEDKILSKDVLMNLFSEKILFRCELDNKEERQIIEKKISLLSSRNIIEICKTGIFLNSLFDLKINLENLITILDKIVYINRNFKDEAKILLDRTRKKIVFYISCDQNDEDPNFFEEMNSNISEFKKRLKYAFHDFNQIIRNKFKCADKNIDEILKILDSIDLETLDLNKLISLILALASPDNILCKQLDTDGINYDSFKLFMWLAIKKNISSNVRKEKEDISSLKFKILIHELEHYMAHLIAKKNSWEGLKDKIIDELKKLSAATKKLQQIEFTREILKKNNEVPDLQDLYNFNFKVRNFTINENVLKVPQDEMIEGLHFRILYETDVQDSLTDIEAEIMNLEIELEPFMRKWEPIEINLNSRKEKRFSKDEEKNLANQVEELKQENIIRQENIPDTNECFEVNDKDEEFMTVECYETLEIEKGKDDKNEDEMEKSDKNEDDFEPNNKKMDTKKMKILILFAILPGISIIAIVGIFVLKSKILK